MITYLYNMAKRIEKMLEAVLEMNRKYDLVLERLERIEELIREKE